MTYYLSEIASALETKAGASTSANFTEGGYWRRIALAAEDLAGASTTANESVAGWMLRTAKALESLAAMSPGTAPLPYRVTLAAEELAGASSEANANLPGWLLRLLTATDLSWGASYSAEAEALFAAMSVEPDATRKGLIDTLIVALKADGVWSKLDWLTVFAAHDAQAGRVNWINPAQVATAVNAPTFTTDRGFTGDGATSYINHGWNPTTAVSPKFVQNSACLFSWVNINATGASLDIGNNAARINPSNGSTIGYMINSASNDTSAAAASSLGFTLAARSGASATYVKRNNGAETTGTVASAAPTNGAFLGLCRNNSTIGGVTPTAYTTRRIAAQGWGQYLTPAESDLLYADLNTFLTAIGAA